MTPSIGIATAPAVVADGGDAVGGDVQCTFHRIVALEPAFW